MSEGSLDCITQLRFLSIFFSRSAIDESEVTAAPWVRFIPRRRKRARYIVRTYTIVAGWRLTGATAVATNGINRSIGGRRLNFIA